MSVQKLAEIVNGIVIGDPTVPIDSPSKIEDASSGSISFFANPKYESYLYDTKASAVLIPQSFEPKKEVKATMIRVENVPASFGKILRLFEKRYPRTGISQSAIISKNVSIGEDANIGHYCIVEENSRIGANAIIDSHVYIGYDVQIGDNVRIFPGVKIQNGTIIGDHCTIQANAVLGSDGFGFSHSANGQYDKIPQLGIVQLGNHVEIGANTVIDRSTLGRTFIGDGVKLDNLIQVAHNVVIKDNTVIAAQTGIAGSTVIGENCQIGGQVGIIGHLHIAKGTKIQAQSGISSSVKEENKMWYGSPAIPYTNYLRSYAVFKQLSKLQSQVNQLGKKIK